MAPGLSSKWEMMYPRATFPFLLTCSIPTVEVSGFHSPHSGLISDIFLDGVPSLPPPSLSNEPYFVVSEHFISLFRLCHLSYF